jgi:DNA-binding NtrC family response regulator
MPEVIPQLAERFAMELCEQFGRSCPPFTSRSFGRLAEYPWPGNVRELRNLVESMVVLAPGREITADDIPRTIRDQGGRRLLPVHIGPVVQGSERAPGRELEFIVRSLVELKLQVEELRRRMDIEAHGSPPGWMGLGEVRAASPTPGLIGEVPGAGTVRGIEPRNASPPPTTITLGPGVTMAEIERQAIEAALRETGGNRRKSAELLGIGERTLYRKLREYEVEVAAGLDDG